MKHILPFLFLFLCSCSFAQNVQISKIIVDKDSKVPLENVMIFNQSDHSITNSEGKFVFISQNNEINLKLLGYHSIKTTFEKLKNDKDTIFMETKAIELEAVIISNMETFMEKVYARYGENTLQNYTANFFLRNIFKKNQDNILLQDIYARTNKSTKEKKKLTIEILNMRKTSIFDKKENFSFDFPNFEGLFNIVFPQIKKCNFTQVAFNDADYKKILFETIKKDSLGQIWTGYFIINRKDYAIVEYSLSLIDYSNQITYINLPFSRGKYGKTKWIKRIQFTKDVTANKYYPSTINFDSQLEILPKKESEKPVYYDFNMAYFVTNSPTDEKIKSNFATSQDVFRTKFPYSEDFWKNQNQLPLTQELEQFLNFVLEKKIKSKGFKIISNF